MKSVWAHAGDFLVASGRAVSMPDWRPRTAILVIVVVAGLVTLHWLGLPVGFWDLLEVAAAIAPLVGVFAPRLVVGYFGVNLPVTLEWVTRVASFFAGCLVFLLVDFGWVATLLLVALLVVVAVLARRRFPQLSKWLLVPFAPVMLGMLYVPIAFSYREVECTIRYVEKEADRGAYMVQTDYGATNRSETGETFKNVDSMRLFKYRSADRQGVIADHVGRRIRLHVVGRNIAWWPGGPLYRNIWWTSDPIEAAK